jgi:voltage-gated potassium channel
VASPVSDTRLPTKAQRHSNIGYEVFILVITLYSLCVTLTILFFPTSPATDQMLLWLDGLVCIVFLADFFGRLWRAPDKRRYFFREYGWLDLLGSIPAFPALRLARLARFYRNLRFLRKADRAALRREYLRDRAQNTALGTIVVAFIVMSLASVTVLQVESRSPEANIVDGADAFWWAFVTIATVGYGDRYPVTNLGRFAAMGLMTVGVAIFGVLTSYLSTRFLATAAEETSAEDKMMAGMAAVQDQLQAVQAELARNRQVLAAFAEALGNTKPVDGASPSSQMPCEDAKSPEA